MTRSDASGRRRGWFVAATALLLLTGLAHTAGQFTADEPELDGAVSAMRTAHLALGFGMTPSLYDVLRDLAFTMSVTFFALTALNAVVAWHPDTTGSLLRTVALVNLVWIGAFVALNAYYRVLPPLICGVVTWPVFLVAVVRSR